MLSTYFECHALTTRILLCISIAHSQSLQHSNIKSTLVLCNICYRIVFKSLKRKTKLCISVVLGTLCSSVIILSDYRLDDRTTEIRSQAEKNNFRGVVYRS
jgi:ABC-type cobalamin transport system permease subunit